MNVWESVPHRVGPRDQTLVVRLGEKWQAPSPAEPSYWSPNEGLLMARQMLLISKLKGIKPLPAITT